MVVVRSAVGGYLASGWVVVVVRLAIGGYLA